MAVEDDYRRQKKGFNGSSKTSLGSNSDAKHTPVPTERRGSSFKAVVDKLLREEEVDGNAGVLV